MLATLTVLACPAALAQQRSIDCEAAFDMASTAYQGIRDALAQDDYPSAYRLKDVFWRILKYSDDCKSVHKMGNALAARKLGPQDKPNGRVHAIGRDQNPSGFAGEAGSSATPASVDTLRQGSDQPAAPPGSGSASGSASTPTASSTSGT
jgi:hypothetical protein